MSRNWSSGNLININSSNDPSNGTGKFTISFWAKTATIIPPTNCSTTGLLQIGGNIVMVGYQSGTGVTVFQHGDAFGNPFDLNMRGTTNITDGNWRNLVLIGSNNSTCFIYVNGVQESAQNATGPISGGATRTDTRWPCPTVADGGPGQFQVNFSGVLAEYAVWSAVLNPSEVAQIYNGVLPCFIRPDNLQQYIPSYGVSSLGGGEAQYGTAHTSIPTVGTSTYADHPPISQLDIGFPGTIGFSDQPEQWTGRFASSAFVNSPPAGFSDWSPPSV